MLWIKEKVEPSEGTRHAGLGQRSKGGYSLNRVVMRNLVERENMSKDVRPDKEVSYAGT